MELALLAIAVVATGILFPVVGNAIVATVVGIVAFAAAWMLIGPEGIFAIGLVAILWWRYGQ
jgi:hypothetical protein